MTDETFVPDGESTPAPALDPVPEPTVVTQDPAPAPAAAASDCVTSPSPDPVPEPTTEPVPDPSPVQTLAPPTSSAPPEVDQDPALDNLLGLLQSIDAALASDEPPTDEVPGEEVPGDEVPVDEVPADELTNDLSVAPYDVPAVELDPGTLAVIEAIGTLKGELIQISDQVADVQLSGERPLLTTPFEDYTVSEGLLLLLLLSAFLAACFRLLRGGFKWLRS